MKLNTNKVIQMTINSKEIDLTKEFEIKGHDIELERNADIISLVCQFVYYPASTERYEISGSSVIWNKPAQVTLIEVKDCEKDLFDLMSERVIMKIEQQILEDIMK